jgi:hypothetical protein
MKCTGFLFEDDTTIEGEEPLPPEINPPQSPPIKK